MEQNEISEHEVRVFAALVADQESWRTNKQLAIDADVAPRTARAHTNKFVKMSLLDVAEVFPGHRFRLSEKARQRNRSYYDRLVQTAAIVGMPLAGDVQR